MTRVAVIGSSGQLGTDLVSVLRQAGTYEVIPFAHADVEVADANAVRRALAGSRAAVAVNCAAHVRVDDCEDRPEHAFRTNALGALNVARACRDLDTRCVLISTDYVFDGRKGTAYTEADTPHPINVYGASKLAGEFLVQQAAGVWLIVRTASLFGRTPSREKGNFVESVLARARIEERIDIVNDVRMSPTYTADLAHAVEQLLRERATGLVHLVNGGSATWYEFAKRVIETAGLRAEVRPVASHEYASRARRPADSSLGSIMGRCALRPWELALREYLTLRGYLPASRTT